MNLFLQNSERNKEKAKGSYFQVRSFLRALQESRLRLGLGLLLLLGAPATYAANTRSQLLLEALDFFRKENDLEAQAFVIERSHREPNPSMEVISKVFETLILAKAREPIHSHFDRYFKDNRCYESKTNFCKVLREIWTQNLSQLLFFEQSAPKLEQARRLIDSRECANSLGVLNEVELSEGAVLSLLELKAKALECLADKAKLEALVASLEKLRSYQSVR